MDPRLIVTATRHALRRWRSHPILPIAGIASVGVGLAASTAVFAVVNGLLFQRLPVRDPSGLFDVIAESRVTLPDKLVVRYEEYESIRGGVSTASVEDLAAYAPFRASLVSDTASEVVVGEAVSETYFGMLGVRPLLGLTDASPGHADNLQGIVVSARLWRTGFDGAAAAIGATCRLNGRVVQVSGVAPASFRGLFTPTLFPTDVWIPMGLARTILGGEVAYVQMKGRVAPSTRLDIVSSMLQSAARPVLGTGRSAQGDRVSARDGGFATSNMALDSQILRTGGGMFLATLAVLIAAAINLASIFLAQALGRRAEYAVRMAVGASPPRLAGESLLEPGIVAAVGAGLGVASANVAVTFAAAQRVQALPGLFISTGFSVDWRVWVLAFVSAFVVSAAASMAPVRSLFRVRPSHALSPTAFLPQRRGRHRLDDILIVAHVSVAVVLLVIGSQLARAAARESNRSLGFDAEHLTFARLQWGAGADGQIAVRRAVAALRRSSAVRVATATATIPYAIESVRPCGPLRMDTGLQVHACRVEVPYDYFEVLGIPLLQGRVVEPSDEDAREAVAVVSQSAAASWWPGVVPSGHSLRILERAYRIVGVAPDVDHGLVGRGAGYPVVYVLTPSRPTSPTYLLVRSRGARADASVALARVLRDLPPEIAISDLSGFSDYMNNGPRYPLRVGGIVACAIAVLALALSVLGLIGVVARSSGSRTREFGVRIALGASSRQILVAAVSGALVPVVAGILIGVAAAMGVAPTLSKARPVVIDIDAVSVLFASGLVLLTSAMAAVAASRGARHREPLVSLHEL